MRKEIDILIDRGFKPVSDLNYCLENGIEYFIGYKGKRAAIVSLMPEDESIYLIEKCALREMSETAMTHGIEHLILYTNYGLEIHSKYENANTVGFSQFIKINSEGYNYNMLR